MSLRYRCTICVVRLQLVFRLTVLVLGCGLACAYPLFVCFIFSLRLVALRCETADCEHRNQHQNTAFL